MPACLQIGTPQKLHSCSQLVTFTFETACYSSLAMAQAHHTLVHTDAEAGDAWHTRCDVWTDMQQLQLVL